MQKIIKNSILSVKPDLSKLESATVNDGSTIETNKVITKFIKEIEPDKRINIKLKII